MSQGTIVTRAVLALALGGSAVACGQPPLSPAGAAGVLGSSSSRVSGNTVPGTYELSFLMEQFPGGLQPIDSTLEVGRYLVLKATVRDGGGLLATQGSVTFEYCSARGAPAPKASCEAGAGSWKRHMTMKLDASGFPPLAGWGACSTPRSIGFRFRYAAQGSTIPSGTSAARDATWVATF